MSQTQPSPTIRRLILPFGLGWIGAVAGLFIGAATTPAGSGLAGPVIALGSVVLGLAIGAVAGAVAAWALPASTIRPVFAVVAVLSLIAAAALVVQVTRTRQARATRMEAEAAAARAPFSLASTLRRADDVSSFITMEIDGTRDTFVMTARTKPGHPLCRGTLTDAQRVRLLDAIRSADALLASEPAPCAPGDVIGTYRWTLPERGGVAREVSVTPACAAAHSEFDGLYASMEGIAFSASTMEGRLICDAPAGAEGR